MDKPQLINVTIYEPHNSVFKGSANDKAKVNLWYCTKTEQCDYFKNKQCLNLKALGRPCPYGHNKSEYGYTRRARNYYKFISDSKLKYKDFLWVLNTAPERVAKVGDEWVLPYPFITMVSTVEFKQKGGLFTDGQAFLKELTPEVIFKLVTSHAMSIFGGPIKDYQEKSVPKLLKDLQDFYPELYRETVTIYPQIGEWLASYSYVGRKALIKTLTVGVEVRKKKGDKEVWLWDGEYLVSKTLDILFPVCKYDDIECRIHPKDNEVITITDDSQVCATTVFMD